MSVSEYGVIRDWEGAEQSRKDVTPMYVQTEMFGQQACTMAPALAVKLESDPLGIAQHAPGAKLDNGKVRAGMVLMPFARALLAVGDVGTYGARKYSDRGWEAVPNGIERYTDALFRHLMAEGKGQVNDEDTGLLHAAHAAWNALARLELMLREQEKNGA